MRDPFAFSHRLVKCETHYEDDYSCLKATCQTPTGPISVCGEQYRGIMDQLQSEFEEAVRNATAHQRLAWVAAAQREEAADA